MSDQTTPKAGAGKAIASAARRIERDEAAARSSADKTADALRAAAAKPAPGGSKTAEPAPEARQAGPQEIGSRAAAGGEAPEDIAETSPEDPRPPLSR